ncbi:hypothetical protein UAY_00143 [Enterococcus moraviensis ATCC BAA-383]|uniref:Uncharacterized protein n=1 Tax=Enterococcus moraviensis ATCC BAA-383 TaxID=1158609 RepID=R2RGL6_9ENTE|nr:hypothetical protein [Enterococcus moraviensis]EOI06801.1 hypothetical protein UAY_00143 [Enterococcus moraviensis ATCC BAA-383]EOT65138.1 hypothetical protein I586_02872 [Enterococcus moraviensis ATCC BAA-383]OJG66983.1 hypothetical protein RV09_GL003200 [Enterococcus moraviensis]
MAEIFTDEILDEAGLKELRKARQKNNIRSFVGTAALMDHASREQEIKSITDTYINELKCSLESLSSNLGNSLKGQAGKKVKEAIKQQTTKIQSL